MSDITSTSFGLVIAYLLPGLAGLSCLWFWSARVQVVFGTFLKTESNVGLFLLVVSAALTVGLMLSVLRWLVFERWWCRDHQLRPSDFASLGTDKNKFDAFTAAVDAHYRYHQFWGGMAVAMPALYGSWLHYIYKTWSITPILISAGSVLFIEVITASAAVAAYRNYVARAHRILTGDQHA